VETLHHDEELFKQFSKLCSIFQNARLADAAGKRDGQRTAPFGAPPGQSPEAAQKSGL
jgi:hypothetical protein